MATQGVEKVLKTVKPILSVNETEAKRRVIALYKAWYREIPSSILHFHLDVTPTAARKKLKEEFLRYKNLQDIRAIDMLVIKGQMEFRELACRWKQRSQVMYLMKHWVTPPKSFVEKFLQGKD